MACTSLDWGRIKWGVTCKALSTSLEYEYSTNKYTVLHNHVCLLKSSHKLRHDPQRLALSLCSRTEKEVEATYSTIQSACNNAMHHNGLTELREHIHLDKNHLCESNGCSKNYEYCDHWSPWVNTPTHQKVPAGIPQFLKFCNRCVNRELFEVWLLFMWQ